MHARPVVFGGRSTSRISSRPSLGQAAQRQPVIARSSTPEASTSQAPSPTATETKPANVCQTCGVELSKKPSGCDGTGREMGGLGAIPGFGWWPIKAYRPCPALTAAGIEYVRKGQTVNETLFGGVSLGPQGVQALDKMKNQGEQ